MNEREREEERQKERKKDGKGKLPKQAIHQKHFNNMQ